MNQLPDILIIPGVIAVDKRLQPLDNMVYALIYWYSQMRLEKCIAGNAELAERLSCRLTSIQHCLTRLKRCGYIEVIMDKQNHRVEIIPLLRFNLPYAQVSVEGGSTERGVVVPEPKLKKERNSNIYKDIYAVNPESTKKEENEKKFTLVQLATILLAHYNKVMGKKFKTIDPLLPGLEYWLKTYSPVEIATAIEQMPGKQFFGSIDLLVLFRRSTSQSGEKVDYIGSLLNGNTRKEIDRRTEFEKYLSPKMT